MAQPSAWPGCTQTGARTLAPRQASSTTCSRPTFKRSAVFGETTRALSQVSLVSGFGSSWSQALLAKRPSWTVGSGRKMSGTQAGLAAAARAASSAAAREAAPGATVAAAGAAAVPGTSPSWRAFLKADSPVAPPPILFVQ